MSAPRPVNYWDYIRVEDLLSLQGGLEGDDGELGNDEVTFIAVHQVFELWFKLVLRELRAARDLFTRDPVAEQELSGAVRSLRRVVTILRSAVKHFEVMETLTTRDYLVFRDKLSGASGFQSAQFRQMEILLGLPDHERLSLGPEGTYQAALRSAEGGESPALARVRAQLADVPSLREALHRWLYRTPIDGVSPDAPDAEQRLQRFLERFLEAHRGEVDGAAARAVALAGTETDREHLRRLYEAEKASVAAFLAPTAEEAGGAEDARRLRRVRAAMLFIETYRELPLLSWPREVLDAVVELEQGLTIFRQRHARMVERIIGRRTGTGGSAGVDYLDDTARAYRVFRDLWAVRTIQVRRAAAPELESPEYYAFARA